ESCGSAAHSSYLETAVHAFGDGATMGDAYVATLRHVLEPLEIAVLDASHHDVAAAAGALLDRAARQADAVAAAVRRRTDDIVAAGFAPQVEEVAGLSLVFLNSDFIKRRLPIRESMALGSMDAAHRLSSTVLLRPVVERAILPSACYVAGPGEFAYFAQATAVADALDTPAPAVVPRWSATIVEPHVQRMLEELRLEVDDLADPHAADRALARDAMPPAVVNALAALRRDTGASVDALRAASGALIPASVLDGLGRSIEHRVARAERRLLAGVTRREAESMMKLATVRGALFPHGVRQERKLAYIPLLTRHGAPLLDAMVFAARTHAKAIIEGSAPSLPRAAVPVAR
ncbi:MAG TPA: bacillithiol biosynthesis BshC, partial [Gemmatimonadaceae bacterium]|nr:bacillithiol biosynthesis BshC [Gemmatimonadaceae bacterium]